MEIREAMLVIGLLSPLWLGIPLIVAGYLFLGRAPLERKIRALEADLSRRRTLIDDLVNDKRDEALSAAAGLVKQLDEALAGAQRQLVTDKGAHEQRLASEKAAHGQRLAQQKTLSSDQLAKQKIAHGAELQNAVARARQESFVAWCEAMKTVTFRNEIEVEVKLIYPLLRHLGHLDADIDIRFPVALKLGSQATSGVADWVVWRRGGTAGPRQVLLVVEAKSPTQQLDDGAIGQARSYAFALNAPYYLISNGIRISLFKRGVEQDSLESSAEVGAIQSRWQSIVAHLAPTRP